MIRRVEPIPAFLGLRTDLHEQQQPLGSAERVENMAQYDIGTLRRIPGVAVQALGSASAICGGTSSTSPGFGCNADFSIPLLFEIDLSGSKYMIALFSSTGGGTLQLVNLTTNTVMTGPGLGSVTGVWSWTFYNNKYMFSRYASGSSVFQIDTSSTFSAVGGTPAPVSGPLVAFRDRLYVADVPNNIVKYSDVLTTNMQATNLVNVKEIPGFIQALAINAPSTDTQGIYTQLVIVKDQAIIVWDETSKDIITQSIGSRFAKSFVNTPAGLIFLGVKESTASVFLVPLGSQGDPVDIGAPLKGILNDASNRSLLNGPHSNDNAGAHAVLHGRFYKLFFSLSGETEPLHEVWLDVDTLKSSQAALWYGKHSRMKTSATASAVQTQDETTPNTGLMIAKKGAANTNKIFVETSIVSGPFKDDAGTVMPAEIEMSLNVPPEDDMRIMELMEIRITNSTAVPGNALFTLPLSDTVNPGSGNTVALDEEPAPSFIDRAVIPLRPPGDTGMATYAPGVIITHDLDKRFDIIGMLVQYLHHEEAIIKKVE